MSTVVLVGYARSGTTSISRFFKEFGVKSFHQRKDPGRHLNYPCYHLVDERRDYVLKKAEDIRSTGTAFEASWELSYYMAALANECPEVDWLVMIRDPKDACNSLKKFRRKKAAIRDLMLHWCELHLTLLQQIKYMRKPPKLLLFEKYIQGGYNAQLFNLFGIERNKDNCMKAQEFLKQKVNSSGEYELFDDWLYPSVPYPNQKDSVFTFAYKICELFLMELNELC